MRLALTLPLLLANRVIANSRTTLALLAESVPTVKKRTTVVYNGVPAPPAEPQRAGSHRPTRLVVVGRLSPRKAPDVALEAVAILRTRGRDVMLELCGSTFTGYEWFETQLRARSDQADVRGRVIFSGYVSPTWPVLERSDIFLAPSLGESFGNAVVEAQLARRPVVATAIQGHLETVSDGRTGLLIPASDPTAMADAVERLMDNPVLADELAARGRAHALQTYSVDSFGQGITATLGALFRHRGNTSLSQ
jgi:hypothetical protein